MPIPEFCKGGDFKRFVVLKMSDVEQLEIQDKINLSNVSAQIYANRRRQGKSHNTYLVINTDEPYAPEIVEILKEHGHWG